MCRLRTALAYTKPFDGGRTERGPEPLLCTVGIEWGHNVLELAVLYPACSGVACMLTVANKNKLRAAARTAATVYRLQLETSNEEH